MSEHTHRFCSCLTVGAMEPEDQRRLVNQKAGILKAARWSDAENISIRFLEGDPNLQARVRDVAREWIKPGLADLRFNFVDEGPTDIRIAFRPGEGSWSYLGSQCRMIPEPEATMNFGWLTVDSPEDELRRVVLHEFGHAIGLIHEHMIPKGGVKWDKAKVRADLSGPPNNWDDATIENNMFKIYAPHEVSATPVDPLSIMMYPIPAAWTTDGFSAGLNVEISVSDRYLVSNIYPQ